MSTIQINHRLLNRIRQLHTFWVPFEAGAPIIYPGDLPDSFAQFNNEHTEEEKQTLSAVDVMLERGRLRPGTYSLTNFWKTFYPDGCMVGSDTLALTPIPEDSIMQFNVTDEHLKLIDHTRVSGGEFNVKRPYGDMTYYYLDMARALEIPIHQNQDGDPDFSEEELNRMDKMHGEMMFVVQTFLEYGDLEIGTYRKDNLSGQWTRD